MMWLLMFVVFSAPMQITSMEIMETHWSEKKCVERVNDAKRVGIPNNASIGCVHIKGIASA